MDHKSIIGTTKLLISSYPDTFLEMQPDFLETRQKDCQAYEIHVDPHLGHSTKPEVVAFYTVSVHQNMMYSLSGLCQTGSYLLQLTLTHCDTCG